MIKEGKVNEEIKKIEVVKKKKLNENERREAMWHIKVRMIQKKNEYIMNLINGRYYMERCNMIAAQLNSNEIIEKIDCCPKSKGYMRAEYALMKMQAIKSMRGAHFAKQDLMKDFRLTSVDIEAIEKDYYDGKIIREAYDEEEKKQNKADFVHDSSKD